MHKHFAECLEDDPNAVMFEDPEGVNVKAFKIWMTILFLVLCVIGIIPKAWPTCSRNENVLSMLNCFSSGIFLAMALLHMMPEGAKMFDIWVAQEGIHDPFPLPYLCFMLGYLVVLLADKVVLRLFGIGLDHHGKHTHVHSTEEKVDEEEVASPKTPKSPSKLPYTGTPGDSTEHEKAMGNAKTADKMPEEVAINPTGEADTAKGEKTPEHTATVSRTSAIVLIVALGVHAVFEGIAFGLLKEITNAG